MDLQICLKTTLKNKYQKLKEAYSEKSLLPLKLGYLESYPWSTLHQHEFRYVDKSDLHTWLSSQTIPLSEMLKCDCKQKHKSSKKTVITLGVSGAGKTTTVQTSALEWAEGEKYQDIQFLFPLTFWELNLLRLNVSLIEVLLAFYPELKGLDVSSLNKNNVWFVLDGLDEFHTPLNFDGPTVSDVSEKSKVEILVTSLISGNLLPNAHVWITTRYAAATQIPERFLLKETRIKGFSDKQKEQHFKSIISDEFMANRAMDHVKISRSLDFLSEIPAICTIMANVLKNHVKAADGYKINRLNLTQIYSKLVKGSNPGLLAKLERLAMNRLGAKNVMYEWDLAEWDFSVKEASAFTKDCPLVLREEKGLHNAKVFRFGQASIQEFLAASARLETIKATHNGSDPLRCLVDRMMLSPVGEFDVLLRFIFGLIKERGTREPSDPLFDYTKGKILQDVSSPKAVGLFHCLREYDSQALLNEVKFFLKFDFSPIQGFTPMHWTFMIQRATNFEGLRESFELQVALRCDDVVLKQLPCILKSRKAMLRFSNVTDRSCPGLAAVLSTGESYLRELDLGYNSITDSGVKTLVEGLSDPNCKLKQLRLHGCGLSSQACKHLTKALKESQKLKELDLSMNGIGNEGVQHLANGLRAPGCHLETLRLSQCNIEHTGCVYLASALQKNPDHLNWLDLSINAIGDRGANELLKKVDITQLTKLDLYYCGLTVLSCAKIGEALKNESSSLVELNLSNNNLQDAGFALICEGMYAWCGLEKLNVSRCGITRIGAGFLAKVLCSISQLFSGRSQKSDWQAVELKELDLSMNCLRDQGVKEICGGMKNPYSHLKVLNLSQCSLTDDCCAELSVGLSSKENVVIDLDLSSNDLQDKGVKKLCMGMRAPHWKVEKLSLRSCGLSSKSVECLITALKSNPQHLAELHLMGNNLEDSSIRVLSDLTKNQKYTLTTIDVSAD
ncbi:NACHT, LRR and PYD domains-containing protein 14-like [Labrus mixtus]|uniref:NACHT, LRR and PYD domains-containing protein 14-like n=1 Tax=Labrus mixtus TaxID=508554 RepID=UPI0029C01D66|nr:NACHT, LRR and PYD domains-containing protein 14-like [Labrus mixtus]